MKNNSNKLLNNQKGFTFIELILYVSIFVMMLVTIIPFSWDMILSSRKSAVQQEVNSQARYIAERLKYEVRNATGVSAFFPTMIILNTSNPATNPTWIIGGGGGQVLVRQGTGSFVPLNSGNTYTNLEFTNYSSSDYKTKNIQFILTVTSKFGSGNQNNASTSISSDAEIRSN
ncbi:MAG: prepilin-type N-terminal cleavage/methylation domain-containing protein [Candidatus Levybacteria bacterium]|nr:prepilin-type N-terminal cleavage/methylation domain-containing protein [Candidatus Levybacteria bacterium]